MFDFVCSDLSYNNYTNTPKSLGSSNCQQNNMWDYLHFARNADYFCLKTWLTLNSLQSEICLRALIMEIDRKSQNLLALILFTHSAKTLHQFVLYRRYNLTGYFRGIVSCLKKECAQSKSIIRFSLSWYSYLLPMYSVTLNKMCKAS